MIWEWTDAHVSIQHLRVLVLLGIFSSFPHRFSFVHHIHTVGEIHRQPRIEFLQRQLMSQPQLQAKKGSTYVAQVRHSRCSTRHERASAAEI